MATTANFSQSELVEQIWTNRDTKTFSVKKKDLSAMDIDALLALAEENNINIEQTVADATPELSEVGIRALITPTGASVHVIDLPLVEMDGVTAYFQYQDKLVMISSDLDLVKAMKAGSIKIGDSVPFHYHGVNTWKPLSLNGSKIIPNNSGDRAKEHSTSGTIAKFACEPIAIELAKKKEAKKAYNLELLEIAEEEGLSVRQVRREDREMRMQSVRDRLAKLRQA
jgi:hypothetical protein